MAGLEGPVVILAVTLTHVCLCKAGGGAALTGGPGGRTGAGGGGEGAAAWTMLRREHLSNSATLEVRVGSFCTRAGSLWYLVGCLFVW